ncbi:RrF2 family transcriptional regulator [Brachybacterium sp. DNPG3]
MRISAKADYAVRAAVQLAAAEAGGEDAPLSTETLATEQDIPSRFLEGILGDLRRQGLVISRRGARGGYLLGRPASEITVADVVRAIEGPLVYVRGERPSHLEYHGPASELPDVWVALRANVRAVLEEVTLEHLAGHALPEHIAAITRDEEAWHNR